MLRKWDVLSPDAAVEGALGSRVAAVGPAPHAAILLHHRVLLLEPVPASSHHCRQYHNLLLSTCQLHQSPMTVGPSLTHPQPMPKNTANNSPSSEPEDPWMTISMLHFMPVLNSQLPCRVLLLSIAFCRKMCSTRLFWYRMCKATSENEVHFICVGKRRGRTWAPRP